MRLFCLRARPLLAAVVLCCWALAAPAAGAAPSSVTPVDLYQVSTIAALTAGLYTGEMPLSEVARHGDFGLGTLVDLDGEMIVLDGVFYQAKSDGTVRVVPPSAKTPFAQVVFFQGNLDLGRADGLDLDGLKAALAARLPDPDHFYAVRVEGTFTTLTARSAPAQKKPWPPLVEALKSQVLFPLSQVSGTMVGIYSPPAAPGLAPTGWHFHFLTADRRQGGHVLAATVGKAAARGDVVKVLTVTFPDQPFPHPEAVKPLPPGTE